jgi:hypothetical protein
MSAGMIDDIVAFLEGLVTKPYTLSTASISFGDRVTTAGPSATQTITLTNNSSSTVTFSDPACTLNGTNPGEFTIISCPTSSLAAGQSRSIQVAFDPTVAVSATAILDINASDPSGVNLSGTGTCANCFTDESLVTGTTFIQAIHITELRTRINAVRAARGLSSFSFTDASLSGVLIKAIHITELRAALTEAFTAAGRSAPSFTDPALTTGSIFIKAAHINELRDAVRQLE